MARTEAEVEAGLDLVETDVSDAPSALALSKEAGWNQTVEDWAMMIRLGRAFAFAEPGGRLVATALAIPYPPDFGWISMVIVHGPYRRQGLGTRLLERSLVELDAAGLVPFLDATPAGRAVYEGMGFQPVEGLKRWRGAGGGSGSASTPVNPAAVRALDRAGFGADRSAILDDLLARDGATCVTGEESFLLTRPGREATYAGPLLARRTEDALDVLERGLDAVSGPIVIDVPDREREIQGLLADRGFGAERPYTRMARGRTTGFGEPSLVRAIAAPELG